MKKYFLILIICFAAGQFSGKAQGIPVVDVAHMYVNTEGWAKELIEIVEQITQLRMQNKHLKDSYELYSKVKGEVKNAKIVKDIMDKQGSLILGASQALSISSDKIADQNIYQEYRIRIISLLEKNEKNTEAVKNYITKDMFLMNDSERIAAIERIESKTDDLYAAVDMEMRRFNSLNSKLLLAKLTGEK